MKQNHVFFCSQWLASFVLNHSTASNSNDQHTFFWKCFSSLTKIGFPILEWLFFYSLILFSLCFLCSFFLLQKCTFVSLVPFFTLCSLVSSHSHMTSMIIPKYVIFKYHSQITTMPTSSVSHSQPFDPQHPRGSNGTTITSSPFFDTSFKK